MTMWWTLVSSYPPPSMKSLCHRPAALPLLSRAMNDTSAAFTWAAVAAHHSSSPVQQAYAGIQSTQRQATNPPQASKRVSTRPPPPERPSTSTAINEGTYVLTLWTDKAHHARMTTLRKTYFPPHLNKLSAHLTLFHALPESKVHDIVIPDIERLVRQTARFGIRATKPFRLKRGIAISIARDEGGRRAQDVHRSLQTRWKRDGFLSEQDAGGCQVHYTIMNKVDDEGEVARAFLEVGESWEDDLGTVEGLALWKYERGWWKWERGFAFSRASPDAKSIVPDEEESGSGRTSISRA